QRLTGAPPRMSELVPTVNRGDAVGIAYKGGPCPEDVLLAPVGVDDVGAPCARQGPQSAGNLQGTLARFVEDLDGDAFGGEAVSQGPGVHYGGPQRDPGIP